MIEERDYAVMKMRKLVRSLGRALHMVHDRIEMNLRTAHTSPDVSTAIRAGARIEAYVMAMQNISSECAPHLPSGFTHHG